jgi:hypothetical protein
MDICAFSVSLDQREVMIFSTVPCKVVLGFSFIARPFNADRSDGVLLRKRWPVEKRWLNPPQANPSVANDGYAPAPSLSFGAVAA